MASYKKITYANVPVAHLDVNNISIDESEVEMSLKNTSDMKNFNIGYNDNKSHKGQRMKIQSTFMLLPYGISAYSALVGEKPTKPSYTMTVGF